MRKRHTSILSCRANATLPAGTPLTHTPQAHHCTQRRRGRRHINVVAPDLSPGKPDHLTTTPCPSSLLTLLIRQHLSFVPRGPPICYWFSVPLIRPCLPFPPTSFPGADSAAPPLSPVTLLLHHHSTAIPQLCYHQ